MASGSPSKMVTSPTCFAAKNHQAHRKPLPTGLSMMAQTENKLDDEITPTGSIHASLRRSPRKLSKNKKPAPPTKTARTKRAPRTFFLIRQQC